MFGKDKSMALKPATTVVPAADAYTFTVVQVEAKMDGFGEEAAQKKSPEGVPLWTVDALRQHAADGADLVSVTVPAAQKPGVLGPARFDCLRAGLWLGEKARQGGIFWQADAVHPAQQPRREG